MPLALWTNRGDFLSNALPADTATVFGNGGLTFPDEGNLVRAVSQPGISPAATGGDYVLAVTSIPANSFDIAGRGLNFLAMGSFASNTAVKTVKIFFAATTAVVGSVVTGGTVIASGTSNATLGSGGWNLEANVFKYGAAGSNTQLGLHTSFQSGNIVGALAAPSVLTAIETATIIVAVTGNAATTVTDIVLSFWELNAMN